MPEWITKIINQAVTSKRACQVLAGIALMVWIWPTAMRLSESQKMPPELSVPFSVIFSLYLGFVLVEVAAFLVSKLKALRNWIWNRYEKYGAKRIIAENFRLVLPDIPRDQFIVLMAIKDQERKLDSKKDSVFWLEDGGYIERRVRLELNNFMYRINPDVKVELEAFIKQKKEQGYETSNA